MAHCLMTPRHEWLSAILNEVYSHLLCCLPSTLHCHLSCCWHTEGCTDSSNHISLSTHNAERFFLDRLTRLCECNGHGKSMYQSLCETAGRQAGYFWRWWGSIMFNLQVSVGPCSHENLICFKSAELCHDINARVSVQQTSFVKTLSAWYLLNACVWTHVLDFCQNVVLDIS